MASRYASRVMKRSRHICSRCPAFMYLTNILYIEPPIYLGHRIAMTWSRMNSIPMTPRGLAQFFLSSHHTSPKPDSQCRHQGLSASSNPVSSSLERQTDNARDSHKRVEVEVIELSSDEDEIHGQNSTSTALQATRKSTPYVLSDLSST